MLFSRPCTYAIRALVYLAAQPGGKATPTREISEREGIPCAFLGNVLQQLRREHLLRSFKGIGGGYQLALPPSRINLLRVVRCVDGDDAFERCILEDRACKPRRPCALHCSWREIRARLQDLLRTLTIAGLAPPTQRRLSS